MFPYRKKRVVWIFALHPYTGRMKMESSKTDSYRAPNRRLNPPSASVRHGRQSRNLLRLRASYRTAFFVSPGSLDGTLAGALLVPASPDPPSVLRFYDNDGYHLTARFESPTGNIGRSPGESFGGNLFVFSDRFRGTDHPAENAAGRPTKRRGRRIGSPARLKWAVSYFTQRIPSATTTSPEEVQQES